MWRVPALQAGGLVQVSVEDDGPGVPDAALPHLFEKFYQAGAPGEAQRRGMGIGLTVVEGLTRAMEGQVSACRSELGGLRVDVLLRPAFVPQQPADPATTPAVQTAAPSPGQTALVEDEDGARRTLAEYLTRRGYDVYQAATAKEAMRLWDAHRADLVLLDLGLPDLDGVDVIRRIRREATTPIIILSARGDERDKIAGLEAGADDYLTKPFATDELNARIRAVLRRAGGPDADAAGCLRLGPIELDQVRREVRVAGAPVRLTPREYELLKVLISNQGRVLTKARLLRAVWGLAYAEESTYLHVYVNRLRRKLSAVTDVSLEGLIETEPGIGYRVADGDSLRELPPSGPA